MQLMLKGDNQKFEKQTNDLLSRFWSGYPIEHLSTLLHHSDHKLVEAGAYCASELPGQLAPIIKEIPPLLSHPSAAVRFYTIDAVLDNISADGEVIAQALLLIEDKEKAVRWKALRFALLADREQIQSVLPFVKAEIRKALESSGLLERDFTAEASQHKITRGLADENKLVRWWAAAAAARGANRKLLEQASKSFDPEICRFAEQELRRLLEFGPANQQLKKLLQKSK